MTRVLEGRNRANADEAASFVDKHEEIEQAFESFKMGKLAEIAKEQAKKTKEQNEILDDAKSQGVSKKVIKTLIKSRSHARKAEKEKQKATDVLDDLEADDRQYAVDIQAALGDFADLPLGAAAISREEDKPDATTAAVIDAVTADMTDEERAATESSEWAEAAPQVH